MKKHAGLVFLWMLLLCTIAGPATAQTNIFHSEEKKATRDGNKQYEKDDYTDAEADYKKALDKKNNMPEATFNLGDAVYKQKRYDEAIRQFQLAAQNNPDPKVRAQAYHNMGNSYLEQRKWEEAVKAYKESLKINANDKDTKYNLAYANAMLVQQKNDQKNNKDKKNDKDKDKNKKDDKKDQGNNKKPDSKPDQKQDDKDQQGQNKDQKKEGGQQMTKEEAEKLLKALQDEEQKTNQKVQQKQVKASNVKVEKDW